MSLLSDVHAAMQSRQYESSIDLLRRCVEQDPSFSVYYELLAESYYELGDYAGALEQISQGIEVDPDSVALIKLNEIIGRERSGSLPENRVAGVFSTLPETNQQRKAEGGKRTQPNLETVISDEPLISIITVVFNNHASIERCLRSVIDQTYKNIEHIVIDAGSSDGTLEILQAYENEIEYFVSEPDGGIYAGMNKGLSLARGSFICILNSDDYYDSTFVEKTVRLAEKSGADIVYTDYFHGETLLEAEEISAGVLLGHLNICHNTFLASSTAFELVGPFNEDFRIVSDALWIRSAYQTGLLFERLQEPLFTLSEGGLSSGASQAHRELFISEAIRSYQISFSFLSDAEAEELYLFRFNNKRLNAIRTIGRMHSVQSGFTAALSGYVAHCFKSRDNFLLSHGESSGLFLDYVAICRDLDVDISNIRISTNHGLLSDFLFDLKQRIELRKKQPFMTVLHFVSVFSSPSETFIYNLINEMEDRTGFDNFVLHDHRVLAENRPYDKALFVPWDDFHDQIRIEIYRYIFERLAVDVVVSHFAINQWKLDQRLIELEYSFPTVCMTHGIDVFSLSTEKKYREYVVSVLSSRPDVRFTAVSKYLLDELTSRGVPGDKVSLVPNAVNNAFFDNRKRTDFYAKDRPLKIVSIGRLIELKGHLDLIAAIAKFKSDTKTDVELTIVYGNSGDQLNAVQEAISTNNLSQIVNLVPFVDMTENPDYLSSFDLYIQPSKFSNDRHKRGETFGIAVLEAILSGLPVIVTDAGGLAEVIGNERHFASIVNSGDPAALSDAISRMWADGSCFSSNEEYAKDRMDHFSIEARLSGVTDEILRATDRCLDVSMFSTSTIQGAGYAALRVFRGLKTTEFVNPTFYTTVRNHENEEGLRVVAHPSGNSAGWNLLQDANNSKAGMTMFTYNQPHISNAQLASWVEDADVVNLHWTARFLSVENIAYLTRLDKPVILTVRDMQPITGGCHFFHGCDNWLSDCGGCPQLKNTYSDFPSLVMSAKRQHYEFANLTLVALSQHSADILARAPLFKSCRIEVIPNSIETEIFKPRLKSEAKIKFGLPEEKRVIGYFPSFSSEAKGYREALAALNILAESADAENYHVMLVGNRTPINDHIRLAATSLGYISDNSELAWAYSAADVVIVPSLEETFSNTTAEAISCGTPVVGFKTGAIPDMAIDGETGYTFEPGDVDGLAGGIARCLDASEPMSSNCRRFAEEYLRLGLQAARYERIFKDIIIFNSNDAADRQYEQVPYLYPELTESVLSMYDSLVLQK